MTLTKVASEAKLPPQLNQGGAQKVVAATKENNRPPESGGV